ncbi:hypothetical protein EHS25_001375 [Saitozyma podzolica]|uniref:Iron-dependent peroxidase n=1 Tax=Saitozyma podzolica TaxID=1890683 RepID=A0A427YG23_9TREE|nr:hypothetical protein EHS25_001375 [Saitozyma podzolica]
MSFSTANTQAVGAPLTRCATFLVLTVNDNDGAVPDAFGTVRSALGSVGDLAKNVAIRDSNAGFSVTAGIGSRVWDGVTGLPRPAELHPFVEVRGHTHVAPSTPGDLLFHIRAERRDLCFEFERQILHALGDAVVVADVTVGFRYFDARDLLGFVDGTANPVGQAVNESVLVTASDDRAAGSSAVDGSYVVVQKYVHELGRWTSLPTEKQESIIGRTKFDNLELDDCAVEAQKPHKQLATITDGRGKEHGILRDNMPFGSPAEGEYGSYFIGYSRYLWVTEKMIQRMFVGDPPGKHDRILDFSKALTGSVFFAPSTEVLDGLGAD